MALLSTIELSSGVRVENAYTKVDQLHGSKYSMNITVQHYVNQQAYIDHKDAFCGSMYSFVPSVAEGAADFIKQAYEYLLTLPEFADAVFIGNEGIPEPAPPTAEQITADIIAAVQAKLDTVARSKNYDGILSLCTYATSTDPTFAAEGQAGVNWRDACWRYCYTVMGEVQAETRAIPTPEEMVAELPEIIW